MNRTRIPGTVLTLLLAAACGGPPDGAEFADTAAPLTALAQTNCTYDRNLVIDSVGNTRSCAANLATLRDGDSISSADDIDWYYIGFDTDAPNARFEVGPVNVPVKCELWTQTSLTKVAGTNALLGGFCDLAFAAAAGKYYFFKVYVDASTPISQSWFTGKPMGVGIITNPNDPLTRIKH